MMVIFLVLVFVMAAWFCANPKKLKLFFFFVTPLTDGWPEVCDCGCLTNRILTVQKNRPIIESKISVNQSINAINQCSSSIPYGRGGGARVREGGGRLSACLCFCKRFALDYIGRVCGGATDAIAAHTILL